MDTAPSEWSLPELKRRVLEWVGLRNDLRWVCPDCGRVARMPLSTIPKEMREPMKAKKKHCGGCGSPIAFTP